MRIYRKNEDMSVTDITFRYKVNRLLALCFVFICIIVITSSFMIETNTIIKEKKIIIHDTFEQLVVLKHGLTEITVDRNANIPTFCNNPGALRPSSIKEVNDLAIGTIQAPSGEFLHFANKEHGFKALEIVLKKVYWNSTIKDMLTRYAPQFENNTEKYSNDVAKGVGVSIYTKVKDCNIKKLMKVIANIEGFKS